MEKSAKELKEESRLQADRSTTAHPGIITSPEVLKEKDDTNPSKPESDGDGVDFGKN